MDKTKKKEIKAAKIAAKKERKILKANLKASKKASKKGNVVSKNVETASENKGSIIISF